MDIVTIDFEIYYDKLYSLRKMTTEEYIRSPLFEIICVTRKINDGDVDFCFGTHDEIAAFLGDRDYGNSAILCHNTKFDGAIMSWLFGIKPKLWLDTLSMARPFHMLTCGVSLGKLADHYGIGIKGGEVRDAIGKRRQDFATEELIRYIGYCRNDTNLTFELFKKLRPKVPANELVVIDQTIRMFTEPKFELDAELLVGHLNDVRVRKEKLLSRVAALGGEADAKTTLMSNDKMAELLRQLGVDPPMKFSKTTDKLTYAFAKSDKDFTALQEHENPLVQAVVAARLGVKSTLEETRTERFIGVSSRGRLPIPLGYWKAHTGRFAGEESVNVQNMPRGGNLRKSLCAPDGHEVVAGDSAQIEARIVAWLAEQADLIEAFAQGRDVYSEFATDVYGRPVTKADVGDRFVGKTCVLGLGYGMGAAKFRTTLAIGQGGVSVDIDEYEAARIVQLYRRKNFKIQQLWYRCGDALKQMAKGQSGPLLDHVDIQYSPEGLMLPTGMPINYPRLEPRANGFQYYSRNLPTNIYGGKMVENIVQALAQAVIKHQMVKLRILGYAVVLQVHDEIVLIVPEHKVAKAKADLLHVMSTELPDWAAGLPVKAEVGSGPNYGEAK